MSTSAAERAGITAEIVYQRALCDYDHVGAEELGTVYTAMMGAAEREQRGAVYTPAGLAEALSRFTLDIATSRQIGPEPEQIMRITALDPACGAGIFLVHVARYLAHEYARRLVGGREPSGDLMLAVLPRIVLECVFGVDNDPIAVDLARLAVSLETAGAITPAMLARHIVCDSVLEGPDHVPPALADRRRLAEP